MKILIDMNLSPAWATVLSRHGWDAVHWSTVGDPDATDRLIFDWARENGYVIFTHDLDFGTLLAMTRSDGPSVLQVRTQDVMPEHLEGLVVQSLLQHEALLEAGALVTLDEGRARVRILPLSGRG
jgi:predicted nuclease of predicted toxin-antitoxin system